MTIKEICTPAVVSVNRGDSVADAARLMRQHHVGSLVVVEERAGKRVPVGMLTDRDIAIGVVAVDLPAADTAVEAAMRAEMVSVRDSDDISRAVSLMRAQGVRRLPVVDAQGTLVGILAADDLLELLTEELSSLTAIVGRGSQRERALRRVAP